MPRLVRTPEEERDHARANELLKKIQLVDVPDLRAKGHADLVEARAARGEVLTVAEQLEYDAIMDRSDARLAADTRPVREIYTERDDLRVRQLTMKSRTERGLTPAEDAELEDLLETLSYAQLLHASRMARAAGIDMAAQRRANRAAVGIDR